MPKVNWNKKPRKKQDKFTMVFPDKASYKQFAELWKKWRAYCEIVGVDPRRALIQVMKSTLEAKTAQLSIYEVAEILRGRQHEGGE